MPKRKRCVGAMGCRLHPRPLRWAPPPREAWARHPAGYHPNQVGPLMHARFSAPRICLTIALFALPAIAVAADDKRDRDIFDYDAQRAATGVKKIVFVADT